MKSNTWARVDMKFLFEFFMNENKKNRQSLNKKSQKGVGALKIRTCVESPQNKFIGIELVLTERTNRPVCLLVFWFSSPLRKV